MTIIYIILGTCVGFFCFFCCLLCPFYVTIVFASSKSIGSYNT